MLPSTRSLRPFPHSPASPSASQWLQFASDMLQGLHVLNKRLHPWQFKGNALDICSFHTYSYPVAQILQLQAMTLFHCNRRFCFENHYWFPTYCTNIIRHTICVPLFNYAMPNVKKYQWKHEKYKHSVCIFNEFLNIYRKQTYALPVALSRKALALAVALFLCGCSHPLGSLPPQMSWMCLLAMNKMCHLSNAC